ncbi:MAG: hypothetical protein QM765_40395 [Myxococcales bacterium]
MRRAIQAGIGMSFAAALFASSPALAQPAQCLGTGQAKYVVDSTLLGLINPLGFEEQLTAKACYPLIDEPGILFDYSQWEAGAFTYVGPIYTHLGGFVAIAPLSILVLRAEASGVGFWTVPMAGAGYVPLSQYQKFVPDSQAPIEKLRPTTGVNVAFTATLQGAAPLGSRLQIMASDTFGADWWTMGESSHYLNFRRDVVLAREDWVLKNTLQVALDIRGNDEVFIRVGAIDDLTYVPGVPGSHWNFLLNQLTGYFSVFVRRDLVKHDTWLRDIEPYLRIGGYTHGDPNRTQNVMVLTGISLAWALPIEGAAR